ncbi:MAG TPA: hypothetical protein VGH93_13775 [Solirubrobacteraceae bacterium]|jgi:hypothetical protein
MLGELIMLPLRVGVRATQLWLRIAEETASAAANATGRLIGAAAARGSDGPDRSATEIPPPDHPGPSAPVGGRDGGPSTAGGLEPEGPPSTVRPAATPQPTAPPPAPSRPARRPAESEPAHVSEEPALVEELAEPGAEDGAGAEVHVEEPWKGYGKLNAKQVIARLDAATPAELAAVQLYESSHRHRQTILNVVQRELRSVNGGGSRSQ